MKRPFKTYAEMNAEERKALREKLKDFRIRKIGKKEYRKRYYKKVIIPARQWIYRQLGNECKKCGFNDSRAFEIHREGGHDDPRKREYMEWFKNKQIPEDVTLLCSNCHHIRHCELRELE